jgi:hypothetical protein
MSQDRVLPLPSVVFQAENSPYSLWVIQTLSLLIIREARYGIIQLGDRRSYLVCRDPYSSYADST